MIQKRLFGDSGYELSTIGLGLAALGRPGYINIGHGEDLQHEYSVNHMEANTHRMLDLAYSSGINYFDTAQSYGKAEDFLSSWIKSRRRTSREVLVGSKWGYTYTADWKVEAERHEVKDHSLDVLNRQWHLSKYRLSPHIKVYQIHSATFASGVLKNSKVLDRLAEIKHSGILIGLSLSGPEQAEVLDYAITLSVNGQLLFDCCQITYNILEQHSSEVMKKAHDLGLGIVVKEGLANGRLTERNKVSAQENTLVELRTLATRYGCGIDAISLAFILQQNFTHIVLSGAATEAQLISNLDANKIQLSDNEMNMLSSCSMNSTKYWEQRSKLKWN